MADFKKTFSKFLESKVGKLVLEAARWAVLGAVSIFIDKAIELVPGANLDPNFSLYLLAALRFIDAALHKSGVAEKGLTRF
jgi:hypothetical protein